MAYFSSVVDTEPVRRILVELAYARIGSGTQQHHNEVVVSLPAAK